MNFNCIINDIDEITKELNISIVKEDFEKEYENSLTNTISKVKINGFRPGKAPRSMIESMYKDAILADVREKIVRDSIDDSIRKNELKVISITKVDLKNDNDAKGDFAFTATLELFPQLPEVPSYDGLSVEVEKDEFSEDKLNDAIKELASKWSTFEDVKNKKKANDDSIVRFELITKIKDHDDEKEEFIRSLKDTEWDSQKFVKDGKYLDGEIRKALLDMSTGEVKEVASSVEVKNAKGDFKAGDIMYDVTLKAIVEEKLPEFTDEFIKEKKEFGVGSVKELNERMTDVLKSEISKANDERLKTVIIHKLLESFNFKIPQVMIDNEIENILSMNFRQSVDLQKLEDDMRNNIRMAYNETAKERIKVVSLIDAIAKKENIEIAENDVEEYLEKIAEQTGTPIDVLKKEVSKNNLEKSISLELKRTKTWDLLCKKAVVSYVSLKTAEEKDNEEKDVKPQTKLKAKTKSKDKVEEKEISEEKAKEEKPKKTRKSKKQDEVEA